MTRRTGLMALCTLITSQIVTAQKRSGTTNPGAPLSFSPWTPPKEMNIHIGAPDFRYHFTDGIDRVTFTVAELMAALKAEKAP